jgi:hypothetical protein
MVDACTIQVQVMPTAQAVPLWATAFRAEVLHTSRKRGSSRQALIPSQGRIFCDCLGRGYDLICQTSPAPPFLLGKFK